MIENYFEKFGLNENDLTDFINAVADKLSNLATFKEVDDKECASSAYSNYKSYKDGELVEEHERKFVNGECVMKTDYQKDGSLEGQCCCSDNKCECKEKNYISGCGCGEDNTCYDVYIKKLEETNKTNREQISAMSLHIDDLMDEIKMLRHENEELVEKLNAIKKLF